MKLIIIIIIFRQFYLKKLLKSYLQLIRLKKRKNYSFKNTIYNFCRFKKHLIQLKKVNLTKKNFFELKNISFQ